MIELHLIGYTTDLRYVVLDLERDSDRGRYRLVVDADLFLTLDEIRDLRAQAGMDVGVSYERLEERLGVSIAPPAASTAPSTGLAPAPEPPGGADREAEPAVEGGPPSDRPSVAAPGVRLLTDPQPAVDGRVAPVQGSDPAVERESEPEAEPEPEREPEPDREAEPVAPEPERRSRSEPEPAPTPWARPEPRPEPESGPESEPEPEPEPEPGSGPAAGPASGPASGPEPAPSPGGGGPPERDVPPDSALSPAQIQSLLRSGRTPESVARAAGTDVTWVERWLPPILTERAQVLKEARALHLERQRKGRSLQPLGAAVATNLARRNLDPDDATWSVSRRADGRWSVNVRYRYRGKARSATWALDRDDGELVPSSSAARELGWTDQRPRR